MNFGDEELMAMYAAGMPEAFDMLFERYRHRIYRFALACLRDPGEAEDIVQEVFVRVARAAERYESKGRFKAWVFQIAANRIRTTARKLPRDVGSLDRDGHEMPERPLYGETDPEQRIIDRDLARRALEALGEEDRIIVLLKEVEGLDSASIGKSLGLTAEAVRVRLHRARRRLLACLRSPGEGIS